MTRKSSRGHGGVASRSELEKAYVDMVELRDRIQSAIENGMTSAEVVAMQPSEGLDSAWPELPLPKDVVVAWIYEELSQ